MREPCACAQNARLDSSKKITIAHLKKCSWCRGDVSIILAQRFAFATVERIVENVYSKRKF